MPEQLVFDLPHRPAQDADDFLVSASNQAAIDLIDGWAQWPNAAAAICGPAGVGKSHLVNVWRSFSGGVRITAAELDDALAARLGTWQALAVEDIDQGIADEKSLFHLLNLARERRSPLLLTARTAPGDLDIDLPDLRSRLRALPLALIAPPDETLLRALLVKLFTERQLRVEPATIRYILTHMERSAEGAVRVVSEIDRLALTTHRRATKALAREVISNVFSIKH